MSRGQTLGVQRDRDRIDIPQAPLPLGHDHRLERARAVPWDLDRNLAGGVGEHRLGSGAVTHDPIQEHRALMFLVAEVLGQSPSIMAFSAVGVIIFNGPSGPVRSSPGSGRP
jgi:hypothetical protein